MTLQQGRRLPRITWYLSMHHFSIIKIFFTALEKQMSRKFSVFSEARIIHKNRQGAKIIFSTVTEKRMRRTRV